MGKGRQGGAAGTLDHGGVGDLLRDSGCCSRLNWRCALPVGVDAVALGASLTAAGYAQRCNHPRFQVFRHSEGHEIAWVLSSGRVQIRVDIGIESEARAFQARAIYDDLRSCISRLGIEGQSGRRGLEPERAKDGTLE